LSFGALMLLVVPQQGYPASEKTAPTIPKSSLLVDLA